MDALGHPGAKGIIHEAMPRNTGQSREPRADDSQVEMRSGTRAGMARVGRAVVHQFEFQRREARDQRLRQFIT